MLLDPLGALIKLDKVGVEYPILGQSSRMLRHKILQFPLGGRINQVKKISVTALDNINFEIYPGDAIGLMGPNGAGKSTLLRVLAGALKPSKGFIETKAKISSLLSSQAGMFTDATGIENTKMLATIKQICKQKRQQFTEEVTTLSGLETYMHLPIRTYSTGMRLRLAFAIEVLSDTDVIILDEHIGTADAAFRDFMLTSLKTFLKMKKAIIMASHSVELIAALCTKTLTLNNGQLIKIS